MTRDELVRRLARILAAYWDRAAELRGVLDEKLDPPTNCRCSPAWYEKKLRSILDEPERMIGCCFAGSVLPCPTHEKPAKKRRKK